MTDSKKEKTVPAATENARRRRSRRQALGLAGAAAAGAAVVAVGVGRGKEAHAATGDLMKVGEYNEATPGDTTQLVGQVHPGPVLALRNDAEPPEEKWNAVALSAQSREGVAVIGTTFGPEGGGYGTRGLSYIGSPETPSEEWLPGPGIGVGGMSGSGSGVRGTSESGAGVSAESQSGPGVEGTSRTGVGVAGDSEERAGVEGHSQSGPGVEGVSETGTGVEAYSQSGLALDVVGKARFSTAGSGLMPARADAATVSSPAVTSDSHITVTFTGDPGRASIAWVERQPGSGFIVHLSGKSRWAVPFTYLIVEPSV